MNGVLDHDSAWLGYTGPGTTWANEMDCVVNRAPGVESIAQLVDHQSSALHCATDAPPQNTQ